MTPTNEVVVDTTQTPLDETPEQKYNRLYPSGPTQGVTPQPVVAQVPEELTQTLSDLRQEIAALRAQPQTSQTVNAAASAAKKLAWVEKIREGKFDEAQDSMAEYVIAQITPKIEAAQQKARQDAYHDAMNASQVNVEVDRYLTQVRQQNPDILPFERYLQGPVTEKIQAAQASGRIKNSNDFLREYRAAVDSEVASLRTLGLQFRAAGKDEANTRRSDVLSSTPITPQQVQSNQGTQGDSTQGQAGEDTDQYFARRRQDESRRRGLS
jgi:hypothetical protein